MPRSCCRDRHVVIREQARLRREIDIRIDLGLRECLGGFACLGREIGELLAELSRHIDAGALRGRDQIGDRLIFGERLRAQTLRIGIRERHFGMTLDRIDGAIERVPCFGDFLGRDDGARPVVVGSAGRNALDQSLPGRSRILPARRDVVPHLRGLIGGIFLIEQRLGFFLENAEHGPARRRHDVGILLCGIIGRDHIEDLRCRRDLVANSCACGLCVAAANESITDRPNSAALRSTHRAAAEDRRAAP
jgi:hypothetical protein